MKKRIMSIATALALCLSLLPTAAFAESHTCVDGDGDHDCDECYETISDCVDEDHDHWCDICGEVTYRTDPLDSGYYVCEAGCGAVEVNVTDEYTELNYHGMEEGTLADGTVEISVCIPNYNQFYDGIEYDLVENGTVTVFWTDEEGSVFDTHTVEDVELVDGKATVSFTDLPIEILHRGHLIYKPADPTMYLPASNGLVLKYQENVHRLSVDSNVDCTINGVYEDDLYLFAGTEVTLIALGDFWGQLTWTYEENSAQPEYKVTGSIVTFTMPEDDVYADMEYVCVSCLDEDGNHWCDFCDSRVSECADKDNDHCCDVCWEYLSELCTDGEDEYIHNCDICLASMPKLCKDENDDHACDFCEALIEGVCSDEDSDHFCDNEACGNKISFCEECDWDEDNICDLCGEGIYPNAGELNIEATASDGEITVTWKALEDVDKDKVSSYIVSCCLEGSFEPLQQMVYEPDSNTYSHTFTGLKNDVVYDVSVEAKYTQIEDGYEEPYSATAITTVTGLPGAPTILSVIPGNGSVTVEWEAPENNGFPEILSYVVTAEQNGIGLGDEVEATGDTMRYTLDSLTNGQTYDIYVSAVNNIGQGAASTTSVSIPRIPYDLLVGGVTVTEENMDDVLGDGTVSFDPAAHTLTLNNANINVTEGGHGIHSQTFLTLKLIGENSISCSSGYGFYSTDDVTVVGDGSLNVAGNDGGIYIAGGGEVGGLYLKENVSLTVASGNVSSTNSYGVRVDDVLEVHDNATLTASAGTALERSCGIYAYVAFNVYDNAVVTTTGTDQSVDQNTDSYGVRTTNMTIKGGTVTATGGAAASSNGIYTQTFDMYGGAVTAVGGSTAGGACFGPSTALQATKSFFCSGGTVTATSGSAGNDTSCGILVSNGHLVVDGGSLFAQSGKANFSYGIKASQLSLADGYISAKGAQGVWCSDGISVEGRVAVGDGTILAKAANAKTYSYGLQAFDMHISGGEIEAAAGSAANSYGLWVFGNMDFSCNKISLNPHAPGFIGTKVNATAENGYAIYSRTGVEIANALTISVPKGGSIATIGDDELSRYYTIAVAEGAAAQSVEIGLLTYKVSIDGLDIGYDMAIGVPAGWSLNETYCEKYGVEDFSEILPTAKDGYTFCGWYTDAACTAGNEYPGFDTPVTEDINIYPKWVKKSGGSSGGSSSPTYAPAVDDSTGGDTTVSNKNPAKGDKVTITTEPDKGYEVGKITVTDKNGKAVEVIDNGDGTFAYVQPAGKVTIVVEYVPAASGFTDVAEESYYYDAVSWAVAKGITSGTSATTFSPDASCTRAQMATFLWRAAGSPEPKGISNPFTDVAADAYYAKAVQWAVEQGITTGTSATTFSPDAACTRAQMATFIYRCEQANGGGFTGAWMFLLPFTDAPEWAYKPIAWCYKEGITSGTSGTTFSPDAPCTRAQMVTFLYRFFVK